MSKRRFLNNAICSECGEFFDLTADVVERRLKTKGYDYEYYEYDIKCPKCGNIAELSKKLSELPLKIRIQVWKKFHKMKD